jgi:RimJ/RimL family protein N-acetyltransferase
MLVTSTRRDIPDLTIDTLSRSFFKEAARYGFGHLDYVRFVNCLLDLAMQNGTSVAPTDAPPPQSADVTQAGDDRPSPEAIAADLPLKGERVMVRACDPDRDLPLFDRWLADEAGRHFLLSRSTSQQIDIRDIIHTPDCVLGIITLPDSTPIGSVAFLEYDRVQRKAELRKLIGEASQRGKGFAKEASALWIRYGLKKLGLRKVYLNTLETNLRNVRLNEDLGFRVEGVLRNEVLIDGTYHDVLRMGLWAEEAHAPG